MQDDTLRQFEVRSVDESHIDGLAELATYLDSVNLPNEPERIASLVEHSRKSFAGQLDDPASAEYRFVVIDRKKCKVVGTSLIVAQLGRRGVPYIFFDVHTEERYSSTLDKLFKHKVLSIGYSYDGPTELGGLVVHPEYRRSAGRVGQLISYSRFMWISMHRELFRDVLLAELLPPLERDGTSHLWNAVGRHFTEMTYREADRLSKRNKEFIRGLFPDGNIYISLLDEKAQSVVGEVGAQTRGVEKMLRRIGFTYADRVDPFDGGPHFIANTDDVSLVCETRRYRRSEEPLFEAEDVQGIAATDTRLPDFHAHRVRAQIAGTRIYIHNESEQSADLRAGDYLWFLPDIHGIKKSR